MQINKRDFLKLGIVGLSAGAILAPTLSHVKFKKGVQDANLVVILLRGGADGLTLLVPHNDSYYPELRNDVTVKAKDYSVINSEWSINNHLKNSFGDFYQKNQAVFIPFAGQPNNSRSHFQAQDVLEFGANNLSKYHSGFLARLDIVLNRKRSIKSLSFTENLSPIFSSDTKVISNLDVKHLFDSSDFGIQNKNIYDQDILNVYRKVLETNANLAKLQQSEYKQSESKLANVAHFMKEGEYKIGFAELWDWDTHAHQETRMNDLMTRLDKELVALRAAFGEKEWSKTLTVVVSEFGRTVRSNGGGTDHGHGNLLALFGGVLEKSQIINDKFSLNPDQLHESRDLIVQYQNRDILGECFKSIYNLSDADIQYIFPESTPTKFNLIV